MTNANTKKPPVTMAHLDTLANAARRGEREIYVAFTSNEWPGEVTAAFVDAQNAMRRLNQVASSMAANHVLERENRPAVTNMKAGRSLIH